MDGLIEGSILVNLANTERNRLLHGIYFMENGPKIRRNILRTYFSNKFVTIKINNEKVPYI